ncbi:LysR family transcriptional regulator [bacterium M00.F.Ca.ET.228.01.1.1]|uniref:LysR family transcriptional regulator n=1 Tax=Paraburkholderia phenoliruptrix TaxID=252970 RepID=UPI001092CA3C|nr:LysR family transcriptional regulator [Paraburkholderia phenoliruptrix]TGP42650.1 LysR family transcriptional regulator [bacterium M00.F.Ca.ET.228.01.1.1]TGR95375.1 LysR family transcriptional regulator [bacterium M00.F.Ca.ET.191.01.1.1]TGT96264.1 LysR family transcriptional regulator [bacterium M00.F.Ca.ET.155.01.1.1]MBW0447441.1 LysR family transcriptional regulator [Paraburkholderia phenoliruptrix]MBW9098879.1 LysR family transcriptional regulator [Paraburkholderia phenoliruptrix]
MDRLRAFEVFVTVVARGGFARAADVLGTSPANVTRYVNELEAHLGTRLLNRTSRTLSLTEGGETLYARCKSILDDVAETEGLVSSASVEPRGRLRINVPVSFGILHLAPLWPAFMQKYPGIELDVGLIDRVVDIVDEGYDIAIRISRAGSTNHAARKLATSQNLLCASPAYLARYGAPATPADLLAHRCIGYTYAATGDEWQITDRRGKVHPVKVDCQMHTNNGDTARAAALAGQGVIWQPTFLIGGDLRAGTLVRVLPDYHLPEIDILALYPSRRHVSARVRVMIDFLVDAFAGVPPWDRDEDR